MEAAHEPAAIPVAVKPTAVSARGATAIPAVAAPALTRTVNRSACEKKKVI